MLIGVEFLSFLAKRFVKEIDAVLRKFLWSGVDLKMTVDKVAWADVCFPQCEGGSGIPDIFTRNKGNIAKHLWDLAGKKGSLWVKWCHMFMINDQCLWECRCPINASWTGLRSMKLRDSFHDIVKYRVGTGENICVRGFTLGIHWVLWLKDLARESSMNVLVINGQS